MYRYINKSQNIVHESHIKFKDNIDDLIIYNTPPTILIYIERLKFLLYYLS